jgi:hypothetical protein
MLAAGTCPALAQSSLKARRDFGVGKHPTAVIAADVDGDGLLDLIAINQLNDNATFLKGFGNGTLRSVSSITVGGLPSAGVLADANGDGKPDLIAANLRTREVTVNLGDGRGHFGPRIATSVASAPSSIVVGDWNRDGKLDVATVDAASSQVATMQGDGTGRFTTLRLFATGSAPQQIVSADFNGDTIADLAIANNLSNSVQVWRGDGTGLFCLSPGCSPANTLLTGSGSGPIALTAGDFNRDGRPDIAVANNTAHTVGVYSGAANGSFSAPRLLSPGFGPLAVAAADINNDQKPDLLVGTAPVIGAGQLTEFVGDGAGSFGAPLVFGTGPQPGSVTVGDFNRDGSLDVVTANVTANTVSLLQSTGGGAFLVAGRVTLPNGSFPGSVVVTDYNNDEKKDVAAGNEATNNISVALGDGVGGFSAVNSANNTGITPISMASGDFNSHDGNADLVAANNGDDTLSYLQGSGAGNFTVTNGAPVGCESVVGIAAGEISGNTDPDIAFVCEATSNMCTRQGTGGSGSAAFGPPVCAEVGGTPAGIALGYFDLDNKEDAAITDSQLNVVKIAISNGTGGITDIPTAFPVGAQPLGVAKGDINGDGNLDLVVANSGSANISALLGDGGGIFSFPAINSPAGQAPNAIALADFNLDGKLDAAVANGNANNISLLLGDGAGRFTDVGAFFGTRDLPVSIASGDFDRDGKPDIAAADNFNDTLTILLNQSVIGDPLAMVSIIGSATLTFFDWGIVPGALYDVIRGQVKSVRQTPTSFDLGAVICVADDLADSDTAATPDTTLPPVGDAYFYVVRPVIAGVPGAYTISGPTPVKPGIPSSGGCS